jgi:hypothetical protein
MTKGKTDIVIVTLEFAREKFLKGEFIDRGDLQNFLVQNNHIHPNEVNDGLIRSLFDQIFGYQDTTSPQFAFKRIMSLESYLGLLDYEDLKQARQDSQEAREEANQALFWTKVSLLLATLVGVAQIVISISYAG